ncbi:hypothetical protein D3C87_255340 [compost metagenome]
MKKLFKLLSVSALLLGTVTVSNAQDKSSNKQSMTPSFGIKGGVNLATVTGSDFDSPDSRTSFHVGVVGEMPVADILSIQAEVLYSGQGFDFEPIPGGDKAEFQLDYINVPVLAKVYVFKGLSLEVGPQFGFLVNEKIDFKSGEDIELDSAKKFDVGVAGGLTFQTDMGLFASGRYVYGVTDIYDDANIKNSVFQIGLGYKF